MIEDNKHVYTWKDLDDSFWEGFNTAKHKMEKENEELKKENEELKERLNTINKLRYNK